MPVDVQTLKCDFLSATGRKFLCAPRGTGFLYVREEWIEKLEPPMFDHFAAPWVATDRYELRTDARRFENWENAYALRAGLGVAVEYAMALGLDAIQDSAWSLANSLRKKISAIPGASLKDVGAEQCAIVSFTTDGLEPRAVVAKLRGQGINIGASDPSSTRLDADARQLPTLLRAAPHYYNTEEELNELVAALQNLQR